MGDHQTLLCYAAVSRDKIRVKGSCEYITRAGDMGVMGRIGKGHQRHLIAGWVRAVHHDRDLFNQQVRPVPVHKVKVGKVVLKGVPQPEQA